MTQGLFFSSIRIVILCNFHGVLRVKFAHLENEHSKA